MLCAYIFVIKYHCPNFETLGDDKPTSSEGAAKKKKKKKKAATGNKTGIVNLHKFKISLTYNFIDSSNL